MTERPRGILVGYDGSSSSQQALSWAARTARERRAMLTVCHAWTPGYAALTAAGGAGRREDLAQASAQQILARGLRAVSSQEVEQLLTEGSPARALCEHSAAAGMVVVGSRGLGGLSGLLLGSVSHQVAGHASGPVIVVRGHWRPAGGYVPGHIVAGVDGSAAAGQALAFAGEEAAIRRVPLTAVCALSDAPGDLGGADLIEADFERSVTSWEKAHPDVELHRLVTVTSPREALLTAARDAQLLVLGSRGRGGLHAMMLGSVSQALLFHAPCPVAVVHPR
jgi:nucleotide-binding universal stress UspA family protein